MPLPASGTITLAQIQTEFGGANPISLSEYYKGGAYVSVSDTAPNVPTSGTISMSMFYGAAKGAALDTPEFISYGPFAESVNAVTVQTPYSFINGDLLVLVVASVNQAITTPSGWTQVTNSPQGTGTAGAVQSIRIGVFTKIASGAQAAVTVADTGNLTMGRMFCFRKVDQTTPIEVTSGSVLATASTTHTLPAITTSTNNVMVAHCTGIGRDASLSLNYTTTTNANLTGLTARVSQTTATASGGGIGLVTGIKTTAGATGTTSVTTQTAKGAFVTLGIKPSTGYDGTARVFGPLVPASSNGYSLLDSYKTWDTPGPAVASIQLNTNGTITTSADSSNITGGWYSSTSTGIGSSYWVRATTSSGTGTGTTGSWLQLSTARVWSVSASVGGFQQWIIKLEFATDSAGTNIVASNMVNLYAQKDSAPTVGTVSTVSGIIP